MNLEEHKVLMRRYIETGEYSAAEALAVEIDRIQGEPVENDRIPEPIPCWGTDAE